MSLASLIVSALAVGLSLAALLRSRGQARIDLFVDFHQRLLDPELHRGRRVLLDHVTSTSDVRRLRADEEAYFAVNRALATLDVLAGHAERGWMDRELVLAEWGELFALIAPPAKHFAAVRAEELGLRSLPWPHLRRLGAIATERMQGDDRSSET